MTLPSLPPELMLPVVIAPPLAVAVAVPAFPAAALPPLPPAPPAPPVAVLLLPPLALAVAVPPSALMVTVVALLTLPPLMRTLAAPPNKPLPPTTIRLPLLPPELILPTLMVPPLAWAVAVPAFPAAALPPLPPAPPAPPVAVLPSALRRTVVWLATVPPLMATVRGPELQGEDPVLTAMRLPLLPPELMLSRSIMPPFALAVAGPAFPAAALPPLPPSALRSTVVRLLTWPPLTEMLAGW